MATLVNYTCESFSKLTPGNIHPVRVITSQCYISSESVIIIIIIIIITMIIIIKIIITIIIITSIIIINYDQKKNAHCGDKHEAKQAHS